MVDWRPPPDNLSTGPYGAFGGDDSPITLLLGAVGCRWVPWPYYERACTGATWTVPVFIAPEDILLLVRTKLGPSTISGIGLFAAEDIPTGTVVWELNPRIDISFQSLDELGLSEAAREDLDHFTYYDEFQNCYILCGDNGRFINHSRTPNCQEELPNGIRVSTKTTANREIKAGEELTTDYRLIHLGPSTFEF